MGDNLPLQSTALALPPHVSEMEARLSCPLPQSWLPALAWEVLTSPSIYRKLNELRVVGNHALNKVWEDTLALSSTPF